MNLGQIKKAVRDGQTVCHKMANYQVVFHTFPSGEEQWLIKSKSNNHCIGLTWADETTLNGREDEFYILQTSEQETYILENKESQDELLSTMINFLYGWENDNPNAKTNDIHHLNQHCDVVLVFWFNSVQGDAQEELASQGRETPLTFKEAYEELNAAFQNIILNY